MSLKLTFSKVAILSFTRKAASGTVKVSCAPSKAVSKAMGWGDIPEFLKSSTPAGSLSAGLVQFAPSDTTQSKHAFDLATTAVRDFEFVRTEIKKGKSAQKSKAFRTDLHCSVDFTDEAGAAKLEQYMHTVLDSSMKVTYEPEAEQAEFDGMSADEKNHQMDLDRQERQRATSKAAD